MRNLSLPRAWAGYSHYPLSIAYICFALLVSVHFMLLSPESWEFLHSDIALNIFGHVIELSWVPVLVLVKYRDCIYLLRLYTRRVSCRIQCRWDFDLGKSCLARCLWLLVILDDKDEGKSCPNWRILEILHFSGPALLPSSCNCSDLGGDRGLLIVLPLLDRSNSVTVTFARWVFQSTCPFITASWMSRGKQAVPQNSVLSSPPTGVSDQG